ncbi:hypothetical protein JRQ81_009543 [Phrynocephalus forsythii]|uniref:IRG-type G domain-containing protein n=1 Tax=Phrynocephalus forsythii TaxID=171643 RepID=A0A9Q1ASM4_9SAUR|nr:hypothetical protein JRQ81_009543 [Phrynocephalus forsythii]
MAGSEKDSKIVLTETQIKDLKRTFEKGSYSDLLGRLEETLASLENISLDVGVTGEPGVGKSSFINAFRDLRKGEEGAAPLERRPPIKILCRTHTPNTPRSFCGISRVSARLLSTPETT